MTRVKAAYIQRPQYYQKPMTRNHFSNSSSANFTQKSSQLALSDSSKKYKFSISCSRSNIEKDQKNFRIIRFMRRKISKSINLSKSKSGTRDIYILLETLIKKSKYILLKNFNLYYPLWCSVRNSIYYIKNDELAGFTRHIDLKFALPSGFVI
jgi:hypothetical protein